MGETTRTKKTTRPGKIEGPGLAGAPALKAAREALQKEVTRRVEMEGELRRSWEYFRLIVEAAPVGVLMVNPEGRITLANERACALFGENLEEIAGQTLEGLVPEMGARLRQAFASSAAPLATGDRAMRARRKDGTEFTVEIDLNVLRADSGVSALATVVDVSERKKAMTALRDLAEGLEMRVEERTAALAKAEHRARAQAQLLETVFNSMAEGVAIVDEDGQVTHFNPAAERMLGAGARPSAPDEWTAIYGLYQPDAETPFPGAELPLARALRGETPEATEIFARNSAITAGRSLSVNARPIMDSFGRVRGAVAVFHDITERKKAEDQVAGSLREKEALLREIHHRVKNNMQVISSILRLQGQYLKDPALRGVFQECQGRIRTMALIHEMLYQSEGLARVDFKEYLQNLAGLLLRSHTNKGLTLRSQFQIEPLTLSMDLAIPVGLIANELISNCLKHGFAGRAQGNVRIGLRGVGENRFQLTVTDDGCGLPPDFAPEKCDSLGLRLVKILTDQIKGKLEFGGGPGTEFRLIFHSNSTASAPAGASSS